MWLGYLFQLFKSKRVAKLTKFLNSVFPNSRFYCKAKNAPHLTEEQRKRPSQFKSAAGESIKAAPLTNFAPQTVLKLGYLEAAYQNVLTRLNYERENEGKMRWNPLPKNHSTMEYFLRQAIFGKRRVEERLQLSVLLNELKALQIIAKDKNNGVFLDHISYRNLMAFLKRLADDGLLSTQGQEQITFGENEFYILLESTIDKMKPNNVSFTLQNIIFTQLVYYSGVRVSSMFRHPQIEPAIFLQWKHVKIWRQERDDFGFKLHASIRFPYLKGTADKPHERDRVMGRTCSSITPVNSEFNALSGVCIFFIALAFRRGVTSCNTFDEWYSSSSAKLDFKEDQLEKPVFTKKPSTIGEHESMSTNDTTHIFKRIVTQSGLSIEASLYSFRRNFARKVYYTLSINTASTLMEHAPGTDILVKYYVGKHDDLNIADLVASGNVQDTNSISMNSNAALFRIKDVSIYKLTKQETRELIDNDPTVSSIRREREELKKKYGPLQRNSWPS